MTKIYDVWVLAPAEKDLRDIYRYLFDNASAKVAAKQISILKTACFSLSENPERGSKPREIEHVSSFQYRQIISKPYRIFYQISGTNIFIFGVIRGERNIQDVLKQRLLKGV